MGKIFTSEEALANPPSFWEVANPEWLQTLKVGDIVGCVYKKRYGQVVYKCEKVERRTPKRITVGSSVINIENGRVPKRSDVFRVRTHYLPYDDHFRSLVMMHERASEADKIKEIAVEFGVSFKDMQP